MATQNQRIKIKKILPVGIILVFIAVLVLVVSNLINKSTQGSSSSSQQVEIAGPVAAMDLNREFLFPLEENKKTITEVKFLLQSIEKRNEIIVKGSRATAVKGRTFLILTVKMTSDFTKPLQINTKDYFRLTVNNNQQELLAPDIHNDPVVVEPTSTEFTRVGWAINDTDSEIVLLVGEIGKEKTQISLDLK